MASSTSPAALAHDGYALVMRHAEEIPSIEHWGYRPKALDVMKHLKRRWDPADILYTEASPLTPLYNGRKMVKH